MRLYLDFGNSRLKWALADATANIGVWHMHGTWAYSEPHSQLLEKLFSATTIHAIEEVWCASVISEEIVVDCLQQLRKECGALTISYAAPSQAQGGLKNAYREPHKLGIDRWLAALAAHHHYPDPDLLVVNMGTATTIDIVKSEGIFVGGWILPGLTAMLKSLGKATWQLPNIDAPAVAHDSAPSITNPKQGTQFAHLLPANNTVEAMHGGCFGAQIGAINYLHTQMSRALGHPPICILTGGVSTVIKPYLPFPSTQIENLVLQGLQLYAKSL